MGYTAIRRLTVLVAMLGAGVVAQAASAAAADPGAERCAVAARVYLDGLVPEQRKRAVLPFSSPLRTSLDWPPGHAPGRSGLRTGELADGQRVRLHDFIGCGLSSQGYQKLLAIIRRAEVSQEPLKQIAAADRETAADVGASFYWITIFGEPSDREPWGWRLEGHHAVLQFTAAKGELALSPVWLGTEMAVIPKGQWAGFRVMDTEFARGLELLESLTPPQRQRAVLGATLPREMLTTPGGSKPPAKPAGIPASALNDAQRTLLLRLIEEYVGEAEPGTAERIRARIVASLDDVHFAWIGPTARGQPVYYRVQGPAIDIEFLHSFANTKTAEPDLNHIHTWWLVPDEDYGARLLSPGSSKP